MNSPCNESNSLAYEVEEELGLSKKRTSIWDEFDIAKLSNAEFKLEFVPPKVQGEPRVGSIELEDITSEIECWKNTIVCYVLGAHLPIAIIQGYIQKLWLRMALTKFQC